MPNTWRVPLWVTVAATQTTTWSAPRWYTGGDCWHLNWIESSGREVVTLRSRRTKALMWGQLTGTRNRIVSFEYGSWSPRFFGLGQMLARWSTERSSEFDSGSDPGPCGAPPAAEEPPGPSRDCGARTRTRSVSLSMAKAGWISIGFGSAPGTRQEGTFNACPIEMPEGASPDSIAQTGGRIHISKLIDGRLPEEVVRGRRTFTLTRPPDTRPMTSSTRVSWTLTITPAKRSRARRR